MPPGLHGLTTPKRPQHLARETSPRRDPPVAAASDEAFLKMVDTMHEEVKVDTQNVGILWYDTVDQGAEEDAAPEEEETKSATAVRT